MNQKAAEQAQDIDQKIYKNLWVSLVNCYKQGCSGAPFSRFAL